ncbi:MAG: hypothetical protein ACKV1O_05895 [Saprospiraceae bacterium]
MKKILLLIIVTIITLCACEGPGFKKKQQGSVIEVSGNFWKDSILISALKLKCDSISNGLIVQVDSINYFLFSTDTIYRSGNIVSIYTGDNIKNIVLPNWPKVLASDTLKYGDIYIQKPKHNERQFILGWLQMTISLCVIFIILSIWINFHIKQMPQIIIEDLIKILIADKGILFISLALFFWATTGIIRIYGSNENSEEISFADILIRIFSLTNNMFFLLSLPYFRHGVEHFRQYKTYYGLFAGALFLFSFFSILAVGIDPKHLKSMKVFDVSYSALVLTLLGYILYKSFSNRGFKAISKLTVLITIGVVFAQVVPHFPEVRIALGNTGHIIYHTTFIITTTLLVTLIFSWYNEEREQMIREDFLKLQEVVLEKDESKLSLNEKHKILKQALAKGYVEQVLNALLSMPEKTTEDEQALILQSANYHNSKRENMLGTITYAELSLNLSKLHALLDDFINKWFPKKNGEGI